MDDEGWEKLLLQCSSGQLVDVLFCIDEQPEVIARITDDGTTVFHKSALGGHVELTRALADRGADVHAKNSAGEDALLQASRAGLVPIIKLLLERGCDPNTRSTATSALIAAAENGNIPGEHLIFSFYTVATHLPYVCDTPSLHPLFLTNPLPSLHAHQSASSCLPKGPTWVPWWLGAPLCWLAGPFRRSAGPNQRPRVQTLAQPITSQRPKICASSSRESSTAKLCARRLRQGRTLARYGVGKRRRSSACSTHSSVASHAGAGQEGATSGRGYLSRTKAPAPRNRPALAFNPIRMAAIMRNSHSSSTASADSTTGNMVVVALH